MEVSSLYHGTPYQGPGNRWVTSGEKLLFFMGAYLKIPPFEIDNLLFRHSRMLLAGIQRSAGWIPARELRE
jgi:hypothetical protein